MTRQKTDNANLSKKLALRMLAVDALFARGEKEVRVLDCFAGDGAIWRLLKGEYGGCIKHVGIDRAWKRGACYLGDNRRYLRLLPIGEYNLIDVDAYGVPYQQMKIIASRHYRGLIVGTFIQCVYGGLPYAMLNDLGYSRRMVRRITKLFFRNGWLKWSANLRLLGYEEVHVYHCANKHYFACFPGSGGCGQEPDRTALDRRHKEEGEVPCQSSMSLVAKPGNTAIWR